MTEMTKEEFLKQKIKNFIIFIQDKIGKDNSIFTEFCEYQNNLNKFLQNMIQLDKFTNGKLTTENIQKYLEFKKVDAILLEADLEKIIKYYQMFIKVINM